MLITILAVYIAKVTIMETAFCVSVVSDSHGTAGAGFCTLELGRNEEYGEIYSRFH